MAHPNQFHNINYPHQAAKGHTAPQASPKVGENASTHATVGALWSWPENISPWPSTSARSTSREASAGGDSSGLKEELSSQAAELRLSVYSWGE